MNLVAGIVVNAAGLGAQAVARSIDILNPKDSAAPFRQGQLFRRSRTGSLSKLIYPVPEQAGLMSTRP